MRHLTILRTFRNDAVTLGRMENEQRRQVIVTLELPLIDANHDGVTDRGVSSIPAGSFLGKRVFSPHHQRELFELQNVPGRSNCQFHSGNTVADSLGCVITGTVVGQLNGQPAVLHGKDGEAALMKELDGVSECMFTFIDPPDPIELPIAA